MTTQSMPKEEKTAFQTEAGVYAHAHAHLLDELRWLNRLIAAHVLRLRRVNFYQGVKDFRSFFVDDAEIDALLSAGIFEEDGGVEAQKYEEQINRLLTQAEQIRTEIDQKAAENLAQGIALPLIELARCFGLSEFELHTLVICLAPQIDARYEKLYAYLQDNMAKKSPGVELILSLLAQNAEERLQLLPFFHDAAPLRQYNLLQYQAHGTGTSAAQHFLRVDDRIVQYLLGNPVPDQRLRSYMRFLPPRPWEAVVIEGELRQRLQTLFQQILSENNASRPLLYLYGREGVGKKTIARALCSEAGIALTVVNLQKLQRTAVVFSENLRLILREGLLQPCAIYFQLPEPLENSGPDAHDVLNDLAREIDDLGWITILGSEYPPHASLPDILDVIDAEIPAPDYQSQKNIWELHLNGQLKKKELANLDLLTANFDLTGGQITRAIRQAEQQARTRHPQQQKISLADLLAASRRQSQPALGKLARKVEPHYTWEDIVLPEDTLTQLREICQWATHRHKVFEEWGFQGKLSQGKGINALFAGPSGTGKTMAAEIIASELQVDLYKIDLSGVVSKYIGETEKNLERIFTAAEHANAILFFDEADALFGKRSEVRDSHDRYANIEISYLLQKMEQYEGLAILATNLRQNLDEAFTRRLAFTVHFPFPDAESRVDIWKKIWPKQTPLADGLDLDGLAREYKFSGGNIKNIALAAAFLAAEDGHQVTMTHLNKALRREYQKMGKVIKDS
jgi:SpoVK/Ycf46/Vps4 family AAA+-type ATPase